MIQIVDATRKYGPFTAVSKVSATIERGEVVGLLGHNGAGKTTLMKMLTGVLEPTSGTLSVADQDLVSHRTAAQRHIGYLPESAPLYPEMQVYDYLFLMAELRGVPSDKLESAVAEAARATGLMDRLAQPIRELSKGYRQRVGIAQAIVHEPNVLVLDEPTNGLDPVQIESIRTLIKDLAQKTTIILSTHILQEVEAVCDRVIILIGGNLVADAKLSDLLATDRVVFSVHAEGNITAALMDIEGAETVDDLGEDPTTPGARRFAISNPAGGLVPRLLDTARQADWQVVSVGPESRTLETVFKELQTRHARTGVK